MLKVSERGQSVIASPIRKFLPMMQDAENRGVKVFKVHVGDPDLRMPPEFMTAVRGYNKESLPYAPSPGIQCHTAAWLKYYSQFGVTLQMENVIPTVGCAEAIMLALMAITDPGDEVVVFEPLYASYKPFATMLGIKLVPVTLPIQSNFVLNSMEAVVEKIGQRTKAIVIINPDNPTGKLWSHREISGILDIAEQKGLFVLSDETYREIRFDGGNPFCLLGSTFAGQNMIVVDSVSKRYTLTGARIGCVASHNLDVMSCVLRFAQARLSAGTLEQLGTVPLLNNGREYVRSAVEEYKRRQKVVAQGLSKIEGAVFKPAQGAFYQVVKLPVDDAERFVRFMIGTFRHENQTVMVTPMQDFYVTPGLGVDEVRIAYVLNEQAMATAIDLLWRGVQAYNNR